MSWRQSVFELLDSHIIKAYKITEKTKFEIKKIKPQKLLNFRRMDLFAKLIYMENLDVSPEYGIEIYKESIRVVTRGSFNEDGDDEKNKFDDYRKSFNELIENIKRNSFQGRPVPVDRNYILLDGAHRTSACYSLGKDIEIIVLDIDSEVNYDTKYFIDRGCDVDIMNILLQKAIKEIQDIYIANVWPSALGHDREIKEIFQRNRVESLLGGDGFIPVSLTSEGALQYVCQIYCNEDWIGTYQNHYSGANRKVFPCFKNSAPIRVYILKANQLSQIVHCKKEIRDIFQMGNHSIHITDSHNEAIKMGEILFNNNSLFFMNYANPFKYEEGVQRTINFSKDNPDQDFLITGSSVLALFGICDSNDLDYITPDGKLLSGIESHNKLFEQHFKDVKYLFGDPRKYFVYFGIKILSLEQLEIIKSARNEVKDKIDLDLIQAFKNHKKNTYKDRLKKYYRRQIVGFEGRIINFSHKTGTYNLLRRIYHMLRT